MISVGRLNKGPADFTLMGKVPGKLQVLSYPRPRWATLYHVGNVSWALPYTSVLGSIHTRGVVPRLLP